MKIAVCVKQVPEGTSLKLDPGTKRLDRSGEGALNHFDANAVEEALRLKESAGDAEVVVVSVGPAGAADALRKALALGGDPALPVAEGDHGREEEAAGDAHARRSRRRRRPGRRGRLEDRGIRVLAAAVARRLAQDRGRRQGGRADRRVPRGEAARLMSILVFLAHHGDELQKGALGVLAKAASLGDADVAAVVLGSG